MMNENPFLSLAYLQVADLMAYVGDTIQVPIYNRDHIDTKIKDNNTPVTEADIRSETTLKEGFPKIFPNVAFIAEEADGDHWRDHPLLSCENGVFVPDRSRTVVVIDPLDGTIPFSQGHQASKPFGILAALFEQGETQAAWAYYPLSHDFLFASQQIATCRITRHADGSYSKAEPVTIIDLPMREMMFQYFLMGHHKNDDEHRAMGERMFVSLRQHVKDMERFYCIATSVYEMLVNNTVCAQISPYYTTPWDVWTTGYLVERAGGVALSADGKPYMSCDSEGIIIARSPRIALRSLEALKQ